MLDKAKGGHSMLPGCFLCVGSAVGALTAAPATGADEAGEREAGEDGKHERAQDKVAAIVAGNLEAGAMTVDFERGGSGEEREDGAGDLQPEDAGGLDDGCGGGLHEVS